MLSKVTTVPATSAVTLFPACYVYLAPTISSPFAMPTPPCLRLTLVCDATAARDSESRRQFISQASQALSAARTGARPVAADAASAARPAAVGRG